MQLLEIDVDLVGNQNHLTTDLHSMCSKVGTVMNSLTIMCVICQANANSINSPFLIHPSASILPSTIPPYRSTFAITNSPTPDQLQPHVLRLNLLPIKTTTFTTDHHKPVRRPWLSSVSTRNSQTSAGKHYDMLWRWLSVRCSTEPRTIHSDVRG